MKIKQFYYVLPLVIGVSFAACSSETEVTTASNEEHVVEQPQVESTESEEKSETQTTSEQPGRYAYDIDFENIQQAILEKDMPLLKDYSEKEVDIETLVDMIHMDDDFKAQLKEATYDDLVVTDGPSGEDMLSLSLTVSGSDDEGNEYESGIYLYFEQGEPSLILKEFLAAG